MTTRTTATNTLSHDEKYQNPIPSSDEPVKSAVPEIRLPRYNTHMSYVEMLDNMADGDPFNGAPPPPKENTPPKSNTPPKKHSPQGSRIKGNTTRKSEENKTAIGMRDMSRPHSKKRERKKDDSDSSINKMAAVIEKLDDNRKDSVSSSHTYVVSSKTDLAPLIHDTSAKQGTVDVLNSKPKPKIQTAEDCQIAYIKEKIFHRQCKEFVVSPDKADFCQCGRSKQWHTEKSLDISNDSKWDSDKHSEQIPADTYGYISLQGFGLETSHLIPYIRVDHKTNPDDLLPVLSTHWQMEHPKLIISVTGGAKRFFMKNRLKDSFNRGLINAATSTGAWIITGGTKTGVMEFVGEAVRDHTLATGSSEKKVTAIGIATWGVIDNKDALISNDRNGCFPATYSMEKLSGKGQRGVAPIDYNHTHFIFVDNGTDRKFGAEISFRAALEKYISESMKTGVDRDYSVHVPVVLLVLEGGENTLKQAEEAIEQKTPVVVVQGSGRAADFIAQAYNKSRPQDKVDDESILPAKFDEDMIDRAVKMFDWTREKSEAKKMEKVKICVNRVKTCLKKRNLITVYHLDDIDTTNEIDHAILQALLKANKSDAQCQLSLSLAWNRCDVARQEIFKMETRSEWKSMDLHGAMLTALAQDRVDFIQLFLDNGVDLKKFLTVNRLHELYKKVLLEQSQTSGTELIKHLLQPSTQLRSRLFCGEKGIIEEELPRLLPLVGEIIQNLTGDHQNNFYEDTKYVVNEESNSQNNAVSPDFEFPQRELFLFAVLLNRRAMASLFWRIGQDQIGVALMGSSLLMSLSEKADAEEEIDLSQDLIKHATEFEECAVGILGECYQRDKSLAHQLLVRELIQWGDATLMGIANSAQQMAFMGHSCCQTKLNQIWKGKMALYTGIWKILLSMFVPFMIYTVKFTASSINPENAKSAETSESNKGSSNQVCPTGEDFVKSAPRRNITPLTQKLFSVGFDTKSIGIPAAVYHYYTAPVTKFCFHTFFYICFLALYSYILMTKLHPSTNNTFIPISYNELILWVWAGTLLMEEIRQLQANEARSYLYKIKGYTSNVWNLFDLVSHVIFIAAIFLRLIVTGDNFQWARMMYAITLCIYFMRFMHVFFVEKNIGPKVIMISRMLTDLLFFMCILVVVILAYGVASQALRYPSSDPSWKLLKNIVYLPYWQMYGELFIDNVEGGPDGTCTTNTTLLAQNSNLERCAEKSWLAVVLFAVYMIMTNVLLLNLLIAMFSYTFEKVQDNSEKVWRFYRYDLIYEYFDRPTFAPPLIIFSHAFRALNFFTTSCAGATKRSHYFREVIGADDQKKLTAFEKIGLDEYLTHRLKFERELIDVKVSSTGERIEMVINHLEQLKDHVLYGEEQAQEAVAASQSQTLDVAAPGKGMAPRYNVSEDVSILQNRVSDLDGKLEKVLEQQAGINTMLQQLMCSANGNVSSQSTGHSTGSRQGTQKPSVEVHTAL